MSGWRIERSVKIEGKEKWVENFNEKNLEKNNYLKKKVCFRTGIFRQRIKAECEKKTLRFCGILSTKL